MGVPVVAVPAVGVPAAATERSGYASTIASNVAIV